MIFTDRTITVRKGESRIDEPIVVYRGDYELEVRFTILNSRFKFMSGANMIESEKASYGQLAILTPYGGNIFSDIVRCNDGSVTFVLTAEMLNQIEEVGLYSFQIRLMDYNKESRVSIPPIEFGIEVREPIASEDHDNSVNNAIVGYSIAKVVDPKEENVGDTFDESGNYNKTKWETGDRISQGKLNKIEDAIDKVNENEISNSASLSKRIDNNFNILDSKIDMVAETGTTVEVIEKITKEEFNRQIEDGTIAHMLVEDNSITSEKIASDVIGFSHILHNKEPLKISGTVSTKYNGSRIVFCFKAPDEPLSNIQIDCEIEYLSPVKNHGVTYGIYGMDDITYDKEIYKTIHIYRDSERDNSFRFCRDYVCAGSENGYNCKYIYVFISGYDIELPSSGECEMCISINSFLINGKNPEFIGFSPYSYDWLSYNIESKNSQYNFFGNIATSINFTDMLNDNARVIEDIIGNSLVAKTIQNVEYSGYCNDDGTRHFLTYMFDISDLVNNNPTILSSNTLHIDMTFVDNDNCDYIDMQLFNNNSSDLNDLGDGYENELMGITRIIDGYRVNIDHNPVGNYNFIRLCVGFVPIDKTLPSGSCIENVSVRLGDIDLSEYISNITPLSGHFNGDIVKIMCYGNSPHDILYGILDSYKKQIMNDLYIGEYHTIMEVSGKTDDPNGLFTIVMLNVRQLIDTYGLMNNWDIFSKLKVENKSNTSSVTIQLFNNDNDDLSTLAGGELFSDTYRHNLDVDLVKGFKLTQTHQYLRLCLGCVAADKQETISASIQLKELYAKTNEGVTIDLLPFIYKIDGLSVDDRFNIEYSQDISRGTQLVTRGGLEVEINKLNDRIDQISISGATGSISKWAGKRWCVIGDSITEKNFRANKNYHDYIKSSIGCIVYNHGKSGSGYQASNSIVNRIGNCPSDSELITVFAGTNDYNHGTVPLGNVGDKDTTTLCGCIYLTYSRLLERFPTKTIAVFTTLPRSSCYPLNEVTNDRGYTLGDVAKATKEIAELFGFPVLDLYHCSNLHPWIAANNTYYFAYQNDGVSSGDGLHPNDAGQKVLADKILSFINAL